MESVSFWRKNFAKLSYKIKKARLGEDFWLYLWNLTIYVLKSLQFVGIHEIYLLYTNPPINLITIKLTNMDHEKIPNPSD